MVLMGLILPFLSPVVLALPMAGKAPVLGGATKSRAAFRELWVARASFLREAEDTVTATKSVRQPAVRASISQAQLCTCKVVKSGKNVPELL